MGDRICKAWDEAIAKQKGQKNNYTRAFLFCFMQHRTLLAAHGPRDSSSCCCARPLCMPCSATTGSLIFIYAMRNMFPEVCVVLKDIPAMCRASTKAPPWDAVACVAKAEHSRACCGEVLLGNICRGHQHQLQGFVGLEQQTICQDLLIRMFTHKTGLFNSAPQVVSESSSNHQENSLRINQPEWKWFQWPEESVSNTRTSYILPIFTAPVCPFCYPLWP